MRLISFIVFLLVSPGLALPFGFWKSSGPPPAPSADWTNLVAYWKLDESSGNRADSVGGLTLSETGGTIGSLTGKINPLAADFESTDARYLRNTSAGILHSSSPFSVSLWFNAETLTLGDTLFASSASNSYRLYWNSATNMRWSVAGILQSPTTPSVTPGAWHFVVVGYDDAANEMFISVDGAAKQTVANSNSRTIVGTDFIIGSTGSGFFFDGRIENVAFFNEYLSNTRIAELYNAGAGVSYP